MKTDPVAVEKQALWAGIKPGMRVADLGCGSGKTTFHLNKLVGPDGSAVGVDLSPQRLQFAKDHYSHKGIEYACTDIRKPLNDLHRGAWDQRSSKSTDKPKEGHELIS